jgi:hypothetical protein
VKPMNGRTASGERLREILRDFVAWEMRRDRSPADPANSRALWHPLDPVDHVREIEDDGDKSNSAHRLADWRSRENEDHTRKEGIGLRLRLREPQEILIVRDHHAIERDGACQLKLVRSAEEAFVRCRDNVDVSTANSGDDTRIDALVSIHAKWHFLSPGCLAAQAARIPGAQLCDESSCFAPFAADRILMIVVVRERRVNVGKTQVRMGFYDLVRRHSEVFGLARDLTDLDVGAIDDRPFAGNVDVPLCFELHVLGHTPNLAWSNPWLSPRGEPPSAGQLHVQSRFRAGRFGGFPACD